MEKDNVIYSDNVSSLIEQNGILYIQLNNYQNQSETDIDYIKINNDLTCELHMFSTADTATYETLNSFREVFSNIQEIINMAENFYYLNKNKNKNKLKCN